jgi:two-component system CheB/CheR fusion protein
LQHAEEGILTRDNKNILGSVIMSAKDHQVIENGEHNTFSYYVGIGASAGGLEAIELLFKNMPAETGMTFIIIQHLSPNHKSMMVDLLSRHTEMPVKQAEDGLITQPNHIYLIPPNHNLKIFKGALLVTEQSRGDGNLSLPIDIFFKSLAEDQEDKSVGIVLSGTGSDGVRGIQAIKEHHGMVMVQTTESSRFDGMPRNAIATGLVDYVVAPENMPEQLLRHANYPYDQILNNRDDASAPAEGMARVFELLRDKTTVDFSLYKPNTISRRIERRMMVNHIDKLSDYIRLLEKSPSELNTLYRELLIGVTNFFRDPEAFNALGEEYLPKLLSDPDKNEFRIWVTGCSTGEEAYSLAMLFQHTLENLKRNVSIKIFATDVDRETITKAGGGVFAESASADIPKDYIKKYLYRQDNQVRVVKEIREMVIFAQHNLIKDPPFTNIDLISCRNLLIYLKPALQKRVMELFSFSLNSDGLLFLGSSETVGDMKDYLRPLSNKFKIYQSLGKRKPIGLFSGVDIINNDRHRKSSYQAPASRLESQYNFRTHQEERLVERLLQGLSMDYLPLCLVVNSDSELLYVLGETEGFFKIPSGKIQNNVTKLAVDELSIPLSTGLQKVFGKSEEIIYSNVYLSDHPKNPLRIRLKPLPQKKGQDALVAILIEENTATDQPVPSEKEIAEKYDAGKESQQRIYDLEQALQFNQENLQATVEELETSNEELQATNEELMASNEELQSTNEELQSVNEELYTVNAEYQDKIIELTEVNNDLENLYLSTGLAMVFLDENLDIRKYTPSLKNIFEVIDSDIGRPLSHISHRLVDVDPMGLIKDVIATHERIESEVETRDGNYYLMRVLPYLISEKVFSGVTLSFVEIDRLKKAQQDLINSELRNEIALEVSHMGSWDWNLDTNELIWSKTIEPMFGFAPGEFSGKYQDFLERVHPEDRKAVEDAIEKALEGDTDYRVEHRILLPNGDIRKVTEHGRLIVNQGHKKERHMYGVVKEIFQKEETSH